MISLYKISTTKNLYQAKEGLDVSMVIDQKEKVSLNVYDNRGRFVRVLIDKKVPAGTHHVSWDGQNGQGKPASAGLYFYRLNTSSFTQTMKMILAR
jgi:flagellar hook assembly protein FlgD